MSKQDWSMALRYVAIALTLVMGVVFIMYSMSTIQAGETSITIGAGWNGNLTGASVPWNDGGGVAGYLQLAHEWEVGTNASIVAHWTHLSQINVGKPFNDDIESSVDHLGVAMKWSF